jgi:hypothetical protein
MYQGPLASSADRAVARVDRMHMTNPKLFRGSQIAIALVNGAVANGASPFLRKLIADSARKIK